MIKVRVKGEGVKLANKWCFINEEATIDLDEYEKNKDYVDIIEEIEEPKTNPEVSTSTEGASTEESQNPEGEQDISNNDGSDNNVGSIEKENNPDGENNEENDESEDEELDALKERAKALGIKNTHNMKKETLIAKIQETEEASTGESQNPEGE